MSSPILSCRATMRSTKTATICCTVVCALKAHGGRAPRQLGEPRAEVGVGKSSGGWDGERIHTYRVAGDACAAVCGTTQECRAQTGNAAEGVLHTCRFLRPEPPWALKGSTPS